MPGAPAEKWGSASDIFSSFECLVTVVTYSVQEPQAEKKTWQPRDAAADLQFFFAFLWA